MMSTPFIHERCFWSYAQARIQARYVNRLDDADWHALETTRSLPAFLTHLHQASLHPLIAEINADMAVHDMEAMLRNAWCKTVNQLAGWVPTPWRAAVLWTQYLPDLPFLAAHGRGDVPSWLSMDQGAALNLPSGAVGEVERWYVGWRSLWPRCPGRDVRALQQLVRMIVDYRKKAALSPKQTTNVHAAQDLIHRITPLFRQQAGRPVAVFCHIAFVALDLERLRGGLVRRRLFNSVNKEAAA